MDRAKVMDKIQKCLNLGKSSNEHEAAAAMRQAQKLMELYDVSERELGAIGYTNEKVQTAIQAGIKIPLGLSRIASLVCHAFGVKAVFGREKLVSDLNFSVSYFGPEHRVILAGYAHVVIARALEAAWKAHMKANPGDKGVTGARAGFQVGWLESVRKSVEEFACTEEETVGTQLAMDNHYGHELSRGVANKQRVCSGTMQAGASAGQGFRIHRPVADAQRKIGY